MRVLEFMRLGNGLKIKIQEILNLIINCVEQVKMMSHTRSRQHYIKNLFKFTSIFWLIVACSTITLSPAHSKDSKTLCKPLKGLQREIKLSKDNIFYEVDRMLDKKEEGTSLVDKYYVGEEETVISEQDLINEANNGDAIDQFKLGLMYEAGKSSGGLTLTKSIKKAMKWWKKSAVQGYCLAQHELGVRYMAGVGVLKDKILAHMWFNIAASNGWGPSAGIRDNLEQKMTPSDIAIATNKARKCLNSNYKKCGF